VSVLDQIPEIDTGLLRFITCGSVDDGKSTLIGRLLWDTRTILADTLHAIEKTSLKRGNAEVDLSLLTDGLQAEREQGITIDVAYRYFSTGRRKYIIGDSPGHEQYTRNMVTAASTADLAVILIDARRGVLTQTRRHSFLVKLLGVRNVLVAINKMDLVNYDQSVFDRICSDYRSFATQIGLDNVRFIPMSALTGEMLVERGENLSWYSGLSLLEVLESTPSAHSDQDERFRFPVQYVCRPLRADRPDLHDFRGFMGRIESGQIAKGDEVVVLPSERRSRVRSIQLGELELVSAGPEQSVTLLLEDEIDISRGDMIVKPDQLALVTRRIEGMLCWFSETALDRRRKYVIRHTTREARAVVEDIFYRVDVNDLAEHVSEGLAMNDIAKVSLRFAQPLCVDSYLNNRATGSFILVDETSNNTVAAGMII
jgi:sulfate adenylyltransferase subunit 1